MQVVETYDNNNMTITEAEELMALGQDSGARAIGR